jgi:hypothetical protein
VYIVSKLCEAAILGSNISDFECAAFCALRFRESEERAAIWDSWFAKLVAILSAASNWEEDVFFLVMLHGISLLYRYRDLFFWPAAKKAGPRG